MLLLCCAASHTTVVAGSLEEEVVAVAVFQPSVGLVLQEVRVHLDIAQGVFGLEVEGMVGRARGIKLQ